MAGPGSSSGPKTAPPTRDGGGGGGGGGGGEMKGTVRSRRSYRRVRNKDPMIHFAFSSQI